MFTHLYSDIFRRDLFAEIFLGNRLGECRLAPEDSSTINAFNTWNRHQLQTGYNSMVAGALQGGTTVPLNAVSIG